MAKDSKRIKSARSKVTNPEPVALDEAVSVLKSFDGVKFDQTVEVAMRLGIDPKQADQLVRSSVVLPHGLGRSLRVAVFAKDEKAKIAEEAGADIIGDADLAQSIKDGNIDFDVCIATPDMMGLVGPLGKVLGPRGLMPSPRAGTVTQDVAAVVKEYKAGKVEFRNDKDGNLHAPVGKVSFSAEQLVDNIQAFLDYVVALKPQAVKGQFVKSVAISATMTPGVRVQM